MPNMNGKKYAYTKEGMRRYKQDKEKSKNEEKDNSPIRKRLPSENPNNNFQARSPYGKKKQSEQKKGKSGENNVSKERKKKMKMSEKNTKKQATKKMRSARKYLKKKDGT